MMAVTCNLCKETNPNALPTILRSNIIAKDREADMLNLGQVVVDHLGRVHQKALNEIAHASRIINGLLVLRHFGCEDEQYNNEVENMRNQAAEAIMLGARDAEYEEEEEEGDEGEDMEDELYVDENGITHDPDCECEHCLMTDEEEEEEEDELEEDEEDDTEGAD